MMVSIADTFKVQGEMTIGRLLRRDRGNAQDDPHLKSDRTAHGACGDSYGSNGVGHRQRLRKHRIACPLSVALASDRPRHLESRAVERLWANPHPADPPRAFLLEKTIMILRIDAAHSATSYHMYMRFYLAARYSRIAEMRCVAGILVEMGHDISCRWIQSDEADIMCDWTADRQDALDSERSACAFGDILDINQADSLICFSDPPRSNVPSRGGHNVEIGVALGAGKNIYVVGPRENVFYFHPSVHVFEKMDDLLADLQDNSTAPSPRNLSVRKVKGDAIDAR
jgi:hypothetical protein